MVIASGPDAVSLHRHALGLPQHGAVGHSPAAVGDLLTIGDHHRQVRCQVLREDQILGAECVGLVGP